MLVQQTCIDKSSSEMNMSFIDNSHFALLAENVDKDSKNEI